MANHRLIRPGLFVNPGVSTLTIKERYLLIGLTAVANDWGKLWYHPSHISSQVFPTDDISKNEINEMLDNIVSKGFICVYEKEGEPYAHFPTWREQGSFLMQYLDKPRPDIDIPDCPTHNKDDSKTLPGNFSEISSTIERNGNELNSAPKKKGRQEEKIKEILDEAFITKMSKKYPKVNVSKVLDVYIPYAKTHMYINDHHKIFEQWMKNHNRRK